MLEDKIRCPHCLRDIHRRPYLMQSDPDAPLPAWAKYAFMVLAVGFCWGLLQAVGA